MVLATNIMKENLKFMRLFILDFVRRLFCVTQNNKVLRKLFLKHQTCKYTFQAAVMEWINSKNLGFFDKNYLFSKDHVTILRQVSGPNLY